MGSPLSMSARSGGKLAQASSGPQDAGRGGDVWEAQTEGLAGSPTGVAMAKRLTSLDAFRGLAILGMLLVNNTALDTATPAQLTHASWNQGVHLADLVFPWFLLIVGVAIPYSYASQRARGVTRWHSSLKAMTRAVTLVLLGWLVDSSIAKRPVIGLGVLQLIGLAYLVGALLYQTPQYVRVPMAGALLVGHWAALRFIPIPGSGAGAFAEHANLVQYLNDAYLMPLHLNGMISVAPTAAMVLIGSAVGDWLRSERSSITRFAYLLIGGVVLAVLGWLWSLDLPFNKPVWTASYILYTAGLGCMALALIYLLADVSGFPQWCYPLVVLGSNAIFAYVAPILVKVYNPAGLDGADSGWRFAPHAGGVSALPRAPLGPDRRGVALHPLVYRVLVVGASLDAKAPHSIAGIMILSLRLSGRRVSMRWWWQ